MITQALRIYEHRRLDRCMTSARLNSTSVRDKKKTVNVQLCVRLERLDLNRSNVLQWSREIKMNRISGAEPLEHSG